MKSKKKIKNKIIRHIKPKSHDISYEYICPKCGVNHWLTSRESRTKNFKIACDCGRILSPARIKKIIIVYEDLINKKNKANNTEKDVVSDKEGVSETVSKAYEPEPISEDVLNKASSSLRQYGFETKESEELIKETYQKIQTENILDLVKEALKTFGDKNASLVETNKV